MNQMRGIKLSKKRPYLKIYKTIKVDPQVWFKLHELKLNNELNSINSVLRKKLKMGEYK